MRHFICWKLKVHFSPYMCACHHLYFEDQCGKHVQCNIFIWQCLRSVTSVFFLKMLPLQNSQGRYFANTTCHTMEYGIQLVLHQILHVAGFSDSVSTHYFLYTCGLCTNWFQKPKQKKQQCTNAFKITMRFEFERQRQPTLHALTQLCCAPVP